MDLKLSGTYPSFLLFTTILSVQVLVCLCSREYEKSPECNKPFQCGVIQNISYPFRQWGSPQYCGRPGFELSCEDGNPIITFMSKRYQVYTFSMMLQLLTVGPTDDRNQILCPQQLVNISSNLGPFHVSYNTKNVTLYYDCPTMANQSIGLSNHQFNCSMNGTDVQVGYFVVTSAFANLSAATKEALRSCRSSVIGLAFASMVQILEHNPSSETLVVALTNGFGLQWSENFTVPAGSSASSSSNLKLIIGTHYAKLF
ncbi:putative wall-associated kinase [Corchorus olitorius]|uniref:Wall-associated kinase n=1 Tax=Corchorus olitorius TaxID=93759 RepID=A0A1R3KCD9_9ROSI|nr:putative wall-associated kinase [Corchorus olitorius]